MKTNEGAVIENMPKVNHSNIVDLVRKWGGPACDAILDTACQYFSLPNIEGIIGYRVEDKTAIAYGDPICALSDIPALTKAFKSFCESQGFNIVYVMSTETFAKWAIDNNICSIAIEFGERFVKDPHEDPREKSGTQSSLVRRKVKQAIKEGAIVKEYKGDDPKIEKGIEDVGISWLKGRSGPQIYISHVRLFEDCFGKRWLYAEKEGQIVGVVVLNQLQKHKGWHLNHLMYTNDAPHGTQELLVISALELLAKEGYSYVSFGSIPGKKLGEVIGTGKLMTLIMKRIYQLAIKFFHLQGKRTFWEKFQPSREPSYILFSQQNMSIATLLALMRALNVKL